MKIKQLSLLLIIFMYYCGCNQNTSNMELNQSVMLAKTDIKTPVAPKDAKVLNEHGVERTDDYYWMRLTDEQKKAEQPDEKTAKVLKYLNEENSYRKDMMSHLENYQDKLYNEIIGRIKQTDMSVPYKDNGYFYKTKYTEGKEYPIFVRQKENLKNAEEVLLNVNDLAADYSYYQIGGRSVSPDNKLMIYGQDTLSRRIYTLQVKDLESGTLLKDKIEGTSGGGVWANDNKTFFYTKKDPKTLRSFQIYRHSLGTPQSQDVLIYEETDDTFYSFVYKSKSDQYIIIGSNHTLTTEYRYLNADNPTGDFTLFEPRDMKGELEYYVSHYGDHWYIRTNEDAPNFKMMKTDLGKTGKAHWTEIIAHRSDIFLEDFELFKDFYVLTERINGINELRIKTWDDREDYHIKMQEEAHLAYATTNMDFDTDILRFGYQSMKTPGSLFDYNMKTKEQVLLKQSEVVGDFSSDNYKSDRIYTTARDGVKVPVSIVYHKDTKIDGNAPCLLYAYGSYGSSMDPYFSSVRLSLLDRGFVYAIAHIRGGQELGKQWYEDGKKLKKKNTFYDFIDCGKDLIAKGYADEERLFAMGGSAGGLLMGAVTNMEPGMWKGVVAAVPFVDVVTTMLDETIPLTTFEFDEWGNPKDKEYFDYMLSYSPYDNVEKKDYPALLVTTGLFDSQVQYWEPAKWVAKMRDYKTDSNPLLMYCNMDTGHGGASGRFEKHKESAMEYAFLLDLAGLAEEEIKG